MAYDFVMFYKTEKKEKSKVKNWIYHGNEELHFRWRLMFFFKFIRQKLYINSITVTSHTRNKCLPLDEWFIFPLHFVAERNDLRNQCYSWFPHQIKNQFFFSSQVFFSYNFHPNFILFRFIYKAQKLWIIEICFDQVIMN